jgi:hypothetical protein
VLTTPKPRAELGLKVPLKEEDQIDPILALGKHGLGRSAAFTSDLSPNWGADWVSWENYRPFVKQLMIDISRVKKTSHLRMWSYTSGNEGVIVVEDHHPDETFLQMHARVGGPRERAESVPLKQVGPRRYQATVPLWGRGRYQIMAAPIAGDRDTERALGGFIVPYSPEYLRFRSNPIILEQVQEKTGGRRLTPDPITSQEEDPWGTAAKEIYETRRSPKQSSRPVFDWFLLALACLLPLDVAVRRIQIDLYAIKSLLMFGRGKGPSTQTMGALLERKKSVDTGLDKGRRETPLPQIRPTAGPRIPPAARAAAAAGQKPQKNQEKNVSQQKVEDDGTTTSRLLAMKRRRQQEDEEDP